MLHLRCRFLFVRLDRYRAHWNSSYYYKIESNIKDWIWIQMLECNLTCVRIPGPQVVLHGENALHSLQLPLMGHSTLAVHILVLIGSPTHSEPPWEDSVLLHSLIEIKPMNVSRVWALIGWDLLYLVEYCVPFPQLTEQVDQSDHWLQLPLPRRNCMRDFY